MTGGVCEHVPAKNICSKFPGVDPMIQYSLYHRVWLHTYTGAHGDDRPLFSATRVSTVKLIKV